MDVQRKVRLERVLEEIEQHKHSIDKLEEILLREYRLEGGDSVEHADKSYGWNLKHTIKDQLREYKQCKNKKYLSNYYTLFIDTFKQDVSKELFKINIQSGASG